MSLLDMIAGGLADVATAVVRTFGTAAGQSTTAATASAGVSTSVVEIENIIKALEAGARIDWSGLLAAVTARNWTTAYADVQEVVAIMGLFSPVAAIVANDMKALEPLMPVVTYVARQSQPPAPGAPAARPEGTGHIDL